MRKPVSFLLGLLCLSSCWTLPSLGAQSAQESPARTASAGTAQLPLTSLVLYVGGVGYFNRQGRVSGNQEVELAFRSTEVNDLLKSLTVRDLDGGRISGVTYGSQDPVEKRLKSFAVNLSDNPGLVAILTQLRGEGVVLAVPEAEEGTLIGVEAVADAEGGTRSRINLLTAAGLRSFPLESAKSIRFSDPAVEGEFRKALAVIAENHDMNKKTLRIGFTGTGSRRVSLGYLTETPVWKTAYRLVLGEAGDHFLQAWAIVENAGDEDWNQVSLSLVSGRPISFVMDLATPRYVARPVVRTVAAAAPGPQTYGDVMSKAAPPAPAMAAPSRMAKEMMYEEAEAPAPEAYDDYAEIEADSMGAGVAGYGTLEGGGNFVRYRIEVPVSLPRRESAMFPLLDGAVRGARVSVYDPGVDAVRPLLGVELVNSTPYTLLAGPLTIFETGAYAGDALIEDLLPGGERLLTYAVDMETEVAPAPDTGTETIVALSLAKGVFNLTVSAGRERTYTLRNSSPKAKEVILVAPYDPAWTLVVPDRMPATTRDSYRFRVPLKAAATDTFKIREERQLYHSYGIVKLSDAQLLAYAGEKAAKPELKRAFASIVEKRSTLKNVAAERKEAERRLTQFKGEQSRIRSNMDSLSSSSDLYKKYLNKLEAQENDIEALLEEIDGLYEKEKRLTKELEDYILGLEIK
jgi:hypothetical protein